MEVRENNTEEMSAEEKERRQKLQVIANKFEEVSTVYGPVAAEELINRIKLNNKLIQDMFSLKNDIENDNEVISKLNDFL